jgi:hypothetical protein
MFEIVNVGAIGGGIAALMFVAILSFLELGHWLGKRILAKDGAVAPPGASSLETAVFALMGLLIAFTFSGALTRFDARRVLSVNEANAIGTAYLRIDLLPEATQPKLRETFRHYVDSRLDTYQRLPDIAAARKEIVKSQQLQNEIWAQAMIALRSTESRPGANILVVPALNEMFDISSTRLAATMMHPPLVVFAMLIGLALASALLAGYQAAAEKGHDWMRRLGFAVIIAFTVYVILDIEYPRLGFVRVDDFDQLLANARAAMN